MVTRDESKLPAWARAELAELRAKIGRLEESVQHANDRLRQATGEEPSPISWTSGAAMHGAKHGHLPADTTVRFKTEDRYVGYIDVHMARRDGKVVLDILGGRTITLRPLTSNHVEVEPG